jgi:probable phosphoglycerate mutase
VLVRHGEANCNVEGVIGGRKGCTGLTERGRSQAAGLAERLARTGELGEVAALYASVLPRAVETARILAPALRAPTGGQLDVETDCALCELHPGAADSLTWEEYTASFAEPGGRGLGALGGLVGSGVDPTRPFSPGGESWSEFVDRAAGALEHVVAAHVGRTVVVVTHAGVVEASMLRFLPVDPRVPRLGLHPAHGSLTGWWRDTGRWRIERYNDAGAGGAGGA